MLVIHLLGYALDVAISNAVNRKMERVKMLARSILLFHCDAGYLITRNELRRNNKMSDQNKNAQMQMEVTVLFPYLTRNGDFTDQANGLVDDVCRVSGGVSTWSQDGIELWEDGSRYVDKSIRCVTIVDSQAKVTAIRDIALRAIDVLEQRGGVFFQVSPVTSVEFLDRVDVAERVAQLAQQAVNYLDEPDVAQLAQ